MIQLKTTTVVAFVLFSILNTTAQTIPNASFEDWTFVGSINTPNNWQGSVLQSCLPTSPIQTSDSVDGSYAILFETITCGGGLGVIGGNVAVLFPLTSNPSYLNGFYKSSRTGNGAAEIRIRVKNNTNVIGTGLLQVNSNASTYTQFSIPITYTSSLIANEAGIWLSSDVLSNKVLGNKLWIDKLEFSSTPLSTNSNTKLVESISFYPNPVSDILNIENKTEETINIRILNIFGQELLKQELPNGMNAINATFLKSGLFLIETNNKGKKTISKFIKE